MKRLLLGIVAGLLLVGLAVTPATAGALDPGAGKGFAGIGDPDPNEITGEVWSAPNQAVECVGTGGIAICTPDDPQLIRGHQCFTEVDSNTGLMTVCAATDDGDYIGKLKASGGKSLKVQLGCGGVADVWCNMQESMTTELVISSIMGMSRLMSVISYNTDSLLWTAAVNQWSFWAWAVLFVVLGAGIIGIVRAMASRERDEVLSAIVRLVITVPLTQLTLWSIGMIVDTIDSLGWYVIDKKGGVLFDQLVAIMFNSGEGQGIMAVLVALMLEISVYLLMFVFVLRNLALSALIMVGPVAWMIFPMRGIGKEWVNRYLSSLAVLLISGPLILSLLSFTLDGMSMVRSLWDPRIWPFVLGMLLIVVAPFAVFSLFSFAGGMASDAVGARMGSQGMRTGSAALRRGAKIPSSMGRIASGAAGAVKRAPGRVAAAGGARGGVATVNRAVAGRSGAATASTQRTGVGSPQTAGSTSASTTPAARPVNTPSATGKAVPSTPNPSGSGSAVPPVTNQAPPTGRRQA